MQSVMLERFSLYGQLCRYGGCFFIQQLKSLENAKIVWKDLYTLYSATCVIFSFSFFLLLEVLFVLETNNFSTSIQSDKFSDILIQTQHVVVSSKVLVNFLSMATGSSDLLNYFKKAAAFEKRSGFVPGKGCVRTLGEQRWSLFRRVLVLVALATSYVLFMHFYVAHVADTVVRVWAIACKIIGPIAGFFFFLYDTLCYVVLRCCSGVLLEYICAQLREFEDCTRSNGELSGTEVCRRLERIRLNMCSIRELSRSLNSTWNASLAATVAGILLANCVVSYSIFIDGIFEREVWIALAYCVYTSLVVLELVCMSQALMDETQNLKNATKNFRPSDLSRGCSQELRFLHESIDPKDMCLSGGGFFRLNKPLLVSMTGSIITYTVILVQTSNKLTSSTDFLVAPPAPYHK
ncbi:unnamed protein product [Ixodes persulcatus]